MPVVVDQICRHLIAQGDEAAVVTYRGDEIPDREELPYPVYSLRIGNRPTISAIRRFYQHLDEFQPDIIHDHYGGLWSALLLYHPVWQKRAIHHVHNEYKIIPGSPDQRRPLRTNLFLKRLLPRYPQIFTVSSAVKEHLLELSPVKEQQIQIQYNAIDKSYFLKTKSRKSYPDTRKELDLTGYDMVIGAVGRFVYEKGMDLVINVLNELRSDGVEAAAILAGDGDQEYIREVRKKSQELGVIDHCRFTGRVDNTADYFRAMDIFMFCSRQEPFGLTLLEAMASEVPIIAMKTKYGGGTSEIIRNMENGILTEFEDIQSLAQSCLKLKNNSELKTRLVDGGSKTVEKQFDLRRRFEEIRIAYNIFLSEK